MCARRGEKVAVARHNTQARHAEGKGGKRGGEGAADEQRRRDERNELVAPSTGP